MSWFSFGSDTKDVLAEIDAMEVQDRIDNGGDAMTMQVGNTIINNYYCSSQKRGSPHLLSDEEVESFKDWDYNEDDIVYYNELSDEEKEIWGSHDNWISRTPSKDYIENNVEIMAEYGSYKNYNKGVKIEDKITRGSFFGLLPPSRKAINEAKTANDARAKLREIEETKRTEMAKQFKIKSEKDIKKDGERFSNQTDADILAKTMREFGKNTEKQTETMEELLATFQHLANGLNSEPSKKVDVAQLSSSIANDLMKQFNDSISLSPQYIETEIVM